MKIFVTLLLLTLLVSCARKPVSASGDMDALQRALRGYWTDYGVLPAGDTIAIERSLKGENSRKCVYIEWIPSRTASDGTFLDEWGTSYRIDYPDDHTIRISSAGPDCKFGTDDDISFTR